MASWKLLCSWWTKHLFEIAAGTTVFALLAGGVAFAIVHAPSDRVVESSSRTNENRSVAVPLGSLKQPAPALAEAEVPAADLLQIVCPLAGAIPARSAGAGAFGCMLGSEPEDNTATPPAGYIQPAPVVPVATAPSVNAATDYSMECGPPETTLMAFTTAEVTCQVKSGTFGGPLNVKVISPDSANGSGPMSTASPSNLALQPGASATVNIAVDTSNGSLGTFRLGVTVQHGGVNNFSSTGDTDKSRTVRVMVTANTAPPFNPGLPPQPPPEA